MNVYVSYETVDSWVEVAYLTFAADTFSEWLAQWPDPTLAGLFPNVTDANDVVNAFGWQEEDWGKVLRLDWADSGFGFGGEPTGPLPPAP